MSFEFSVELPSVNANKVFMENKTQEAFYKKIRYNAMRNKKITNLCRSPDSTIITEEGSANSDIDYT